MKKIYYTYAALGLSVLLGIVILVKMNTPEEPIDNNPPTNELPTDPIDEEPVLRQPFNGREIEAETSYKAFAIMIENTAAARPQSGIAEADIVYEISVDGWAISRFMAIFSETHPSKVGPVRSARVPFAELLKELKLPFAHYGSASTGQGDALSIIRALNLPIRFDGHQGINAEFYSRDDARSAPHNAYFDAEAALVKIPLRDYEPRFKFHSSTNVNDRSVSEIDFNYSSSNQIKYIYDSTLKAYKRFINDNPMMDAYTNKQVTVTNIVALHAPHRDVESVRYVLVDFVGEGKAEFFINGQYEEGTWKKATASSTTQYFDSVGREITFLPGNTWIQVVHPNIEILKDSEK